MGKFCVLLVMAIAFNQALCMNLRQKRQSDNPEEDLEDRYGWEGRPVRPNWNQFQQGQGRPFRPGQQFPGQGGNTGQGQFPGQGGNNGQGQFPGQGGNNGQGQQTTQAPATSTTVSSAIRECIRTCPVTPEYNPVCGSDNVTYDNPGRLLCAQDCGTIVSQVRMSRCPTAAT